MTSFEQARAFSPEEIIELYPRYYSSGQLNCWRRLFMDDAVLIRESRDGHRLELPIDKALFRQYLYLNSTRHHQEVWKNPRITTRGEQLVITVDYELTDDRHVLTGRDALLLAKSGEGWKIQRLVYDVRKVIPIDSGVAEADPDETNLLAALRWQSLVRPAAQAVITPRGTINFKELEALVWRAAHFLHGQGVRAGDVLGMCFRGELPGLIALLAVVRLGATVFTLPASLSVNAREALVTGMDLAAVVTDQAKITTGFARVIPFSLQTIAGLPMAVDLSIADANPRAPWLIITGSGTTGKPKRIPITHRVFRAQMDLYRRALELKPGDRVASLMSPDMVVTKERFLEALLGGATVVMSDPAQPTLEWLREKAVTVLWGTVIHMENFLAGHPPVNPEAFTTLRALMVGSSTVTPSLRTRVADKLSNKLHVYYGTNEVGLISLADLADSAGDPESVGTPVAGVDVEIVSKNGQPCPVTEVGLIRVRSPGSAGTYLDAAEASAKSFRDGWFYPGDLGKFTTTGQLVFCGRADDMMIMNGMNIYPVEIEQVLTSHTAVVDAVAFPQPHAIHQDLPCCAVTLAAGSPETAESLLQYAREFMGSRGPQRIFILPSIPRNAQGKVIRQQLLEATFGKSVE